MLLIASEFIGIYAEALGVVVDGLYRVEYIMKQMASKHGDGNLFLDPNIR